MSDALNDLLKILDLEELERNRFRGQNESADRPHLFGGQVMAQALAAAGATIDGLFAHSLHAHFLQRGDPAIPVIYQVDRIREGVRSASRRITACQGDETISTLVASFQEDRAGFEHGEPMPEVAAPEGLPSMPEQAEAAGVPPALREWLRADHPIDLRPAEGPGLLRGDGQTGALHFWLRAAGALPDDPLLHQCVAAYASDLGPIEAAIRRHVVGFALDEANPVSLDHTLWFHRPLRIDEWLLHRLECPVAASGRHLVRGSLFTRDGASVASMAQELLVRPAVPEE